MNFLPEIQEIIYRYVYEPPVAPPRPKECHTNYLIGGRNDDNLRRLPNRCGKLANPLSYVEYTFKNSWSSGSSKLLGYCETCKEKIIECMLEECTPNMYYLDKDAIQTITSNGKIIYNRNSFIEILRRVVLPFLYILTIAISCSISDRYT